jgi:hypothetical protein
MKKSTKYTLKGVKFSMCHEGDPKGAWEATLYKDGKRIGHVVNDGSGGCLNYPDVDHKDEMDIYAWMKEHAPKYWCQFSKKWVENNDEVYFGELVTRFQFAQEVRRKCKKGTILVLPKHRVGQWEQWNAVFDDNMSKFLKQEYPDVDYFVINEHLDDTDLCYDKVFTEKQAIRDGAPALSE